MALGKRKILAMQSSWIGFVLRLFICALCANSSPTTSCEIYRTYEPCLMADWAPQLQRMKPLLRTGMGGSMALLSKEVRCGNLWALPIFFLHPSKDFELNATCLSYRSLSLFVCRMASGCEQVKEGISAEFAQLKAEDGSTPLLQHCRVQLRDYFLRKNVQKRLLAEIAPLLLQLSDKPNARRFYDDDEFWVRLDGGDRLALSNMLRCPNRLPAPAFNMPFLVSGHSIIQAMVFARLHFVSSSLPYMHCVGLIGSNVLRRMQTCASIAR